ncbi:MAG: hypothetical protein O6850_05145, partial [Acidobacteria bacterium]|nr:hypothetical protein [Acidobacteriota bacterium]
MRAFPSLAKIAVAAVACHLAYWAAVFLIRVVPQMTLAALTDVEILRFYNRGPWPGLSTRFPSDGSPTLYAAYLAGFLIWAGAAIPVALAGVRKAAGWLRLFLIYSILWVSAWLLFYLTGFVISAQGPLGAAL